MQVSNILGIFVHYYCCFFCSFLKKKEKNLLSSVKVDVKVCDGS